MSVVALDTISMRKPGWPVAVQIARREGRRMLRHPVTWVGGLFSLVMMGFSTWHLAPVLHRDDTNVAGALLPLAAATMIVANLAASRAERNSTVELYDATASPRALRTLGLLLGLAYVVTFSVLLIGVMFVYLLLDSPVGTPDIAEVAAGPVVVVLFGAIGIALGSWRSHPAMGPLGVVVAIALQLLLMQPIIDLASTNSTVRNPIPWLAPWVPLSLTGEVPPELVIRPAGWHLLYLLGLAVVAVGLALLRHSSKRRILPLFLAGAAAVILGTVAQFTPAGATEKEEIASLLLQPEDHQVCEVRRDVTYCAYPAYASWIDRWAAPIEGALDRIPEEARPDDLVVRQRFGTYFEGPIDVPETTLRELERAQRRATPPRAPGTTIWTPARWGRGSTEGGYAIGLSLAVAMQALDFPTSRAEMVPTAEEVARFERSVVPTLDKRFQKRAARAIRGRGSRLYSCNTMYQARALAAMWIAAQATPGTRNTVIRAAAENPYGLTVHEHEGKRIAYYVGPFMPIYPLVPPPMWDRVSFADAEFHYAAKLLERPQDEVAEVFTEGWNELRDPFVTTESLLDDLGLSPHPTIDQQIERLPEGVQLEQHRNMWSPAAFFVQTAPCL